MEANDIRQREIEAFSYRAAHDLKTPLNAVRGFAYLLHAHYGAAMPDEGRTLLQHIDRSAADMQALIDALLALSGLGRRPPQREPVDLSAMAYDIWRELEIHSPMPPECVRIEPELQAQAERGLVRSLLLNLLDNAKKYSACCAQPLIVFDQLSTPQGPAFRVHDNGIGFEAGAAAPQLFMPFARFHDAAHFDGHGLGLATCMRIVQHHGGTIWLESRPGEGTSVYFTLPGSAVPEPPSRPSR